MLKDLSKRIAKKALQLKILSQYFNTVSTKLIDIKAENEDEILSELKKALQNLKPILSNLEDSISKLENPKSDEPTIVDNTTLLISEIQNKVVLPYTVTDLNKHLSSCSDYSSLQDVIDKVYTIPIDNYKNSLTSRFKETYNLMRKKENSSILDSLNLAIELSFNNLLNPAIITACKNLDELDIYLDCLSSNELEKFNIFNVKYEILPKK